MGISSGNLQDFITNGAGTRNTRVKQVKFDSLLQNFEFDQWQGLDYMYDIEPQSQNLFYAGYFCEAGDGSAEKSMKMFYNAAYRIKKVSIPFPSLEMEYHPETRIPMVKSVSYTNDITIDWFEDVYHSVQKYHLDWFNRWYSREFDCFRCGIKGKFRKVAIVAFHYVNDDINAVIPIPKIEPMFAFIIGGLTPKSMPSINWDYNSDGNDQLVSMNYGCGPIRWVFSDKLGIGGHAMEDAIFQDDGSKAKGALTDIHKNTPFPQTSWDSVPLSEDKGPNAVSWEKLRLVRAATYFQAAEASL